MLTSATHTPPGARSMFAKKHSHGVQRCCTSRSHFGSRWLRNCMSVVLDLWQSVCSIGVRLLSCFISDLELKLLCTALVAIALLARVGRCRLRVRRVSLRRSRLQNTAVVRWFLDTFCASLIGFNRSERLLRLARQGRLRYGSSPLV